MNVARNELCGDQRHQDCNRSSSTRAARVILCVLALGFVISAVPAAALTVSISGPTSTIGVAYQDCVTATFTANPSESVTYTWTWDSYIVGSGSSYSHTFCNDQALGYAYSESHTVAVAVSNGSQLAYASMGVHVVFQAANSQGPCGTQVLCEPNDGSW